MSRLVESDLVFTFPADWTVRKYDHTVAYQSLSGHGLKGVDFIALAPERRLWLIEVKNYRPRLSPRNGRRYPATLKTPEGLAEQVAGKFTDSERLVRIVCAYLQRSWWRRWVVRWRRWRPAPSSNYWFWTEAELRLRSPKPLRYVLWLEIPEGETAYPEWVGDRLSDALPELSITVASIGRPADLPFSAVCEAG